MENNFAYDLAFGEVGERWVKQLLGGDFKVEVKTDRLAAVTGNIFIEVFYRGIPSGISTTQAEYWVYRIDSIDSALVIPTAMLKDIVRQQFIKNGLRNVGQDARGVIIPILSIFKYIPSNS